MTFWWKFASRLSVKWGMSSFHATRRASARSSSVQQPPYVVSDAARLSYICIDSPTTSCPSDLSRYAAVDESTPPDMATAIFIGFGPADATRHRPLNGMRRGDLPVTGHELAVGECDNLKSNGRAC